MERVLELIERNITSGAMPRFGVTDAIEILIIAFLIYEVMIWVKNTKAWTLFRGIMVILVFVFVAYFFQMNTILWIVKNGTTVAITVLIVIFQPELRKALDTLGRRNMLASFIPVEVSGNVSAGFTEKTANEIAKACFEMGKVKTGALITIERGTSLSEFERTGIPVDAIVSSQLLINIFEHNTPLHDGAVIIRGDRILTATSYFPLSDNMSLSKELGTRHRAGVGVSEVSDSITVIVSEETGFVSVAIEGVLYRKCSMDELKEKLMLARSAVAEEKHFLKRFIRRSGK